jgi:glycosyltransferase involved in cell wall biosynthesis
MDEAVANGDSGILVRAGTWDEFGDALLTLLDDGELRARMGLAGRCVVADRFAIDQCARRFEAILAEVGR